MARIYYRSVPFDKPSVTLALEAGVDGLIVPQEHAASVQALARGEVLAEENMNYIKLSSKSDEENAIAALKKGDQVIIQSGWEVIPIENMLAQADNVMVETPTLESAQLAGGILERGVATMVVPSENIDQLRAIIGACKISQPHQILEHARITAIRQAGLGHRVCLDTLTLLQRGQGMLVGNSSAFTFLVHAETEHNDYVASRPFRVNAGGAHAYLRLPHDRTCYLGEVKAGDVGLVVSANGDTQIATIGRVKIEVRPMLLIEAEVKNENGVQKGAIFLQNAETIRLTRPDGAPVSVVSLKEGDEVLCRLDQAGRHFGMRIIEDIREV